MIMGLLGPDGTFTTQIGYEYQKKTKYQTRNYTIQNN